MDDRLHTAFVINFNSICIPSVAKHQTYTQLVSCHVAYRSVNASVTSDEVGRRHRVLPKTSTLTNDRNPKVSLNTISDYIGLHRIALDFIKLQCGCSGATTTQKLGVQKYGERGSSVVAVLYV